MSRSITIIIRFLIFRVHPPAYRLFLSGRERYVILCKMFENHFSDGSCRQIKQRFTMLKRALFVDERKIYLNGNNKIHDLESTQRGPTMAHERLGLFTRTALTAATFSGVYERFFRLLYYRKPSPFPQSRSSAHFNGVSRRRYRDRAPSQCRNEHVTVVIFVKRFRRKSALLKPFRSFAK